MFLTLEFLKKDVRIYQKKNQEEVSQWIRQHIPIVKVNSLIFPLLII